MEPSPHATCAEFGRRLDDASWIQARNRRCDDAPAPAVMLVPSGRQSSREKAVPED